MPSSSNQNPKLSAMFVFAPDRAVTFVSKQVRANGGDLQATAKGLGVSRMTLYRWIEKYRDLQVAVDRARWEQAERRKG
jgi:transcriptional regulator with PAS, ATPase and Fis domain